MPSGYITAYQNPWGNNNATLNINEGMGNPQYLPDQMGLQQDQEDWQSSENAKNRHLEMDLAKLPIEWQKQKYGNVTGSGLYQSLIGGVNSQIGGQNTPQPTITQGPVWNDQQINQQVNQSLANNQQQAATQNKQIANKAAGQGYASKSPLIAALQGQTNASLMANNASSEQNIRWNAAEGNANQLLNSQKAAEQQWADWQDADIRRRQSANQGQASLLAALGAYL